MNGWQVYRDRDSKPAQREYIETAQSSETAARDAEYVRKRLPKADRIWYEHAPRPQDVPTFDIRELTEKVPEEAM